jgi:indoleamine 2,3-dioxygenase
VWLQVMEHIIVSQLKMFNASDPKNYEKCVRPWIFGWKGNADFDHGVVFEGTDTSPTFLRGETGAQSTIIPSLDIVLGITHKADELRAMLQDLELYRPKPQRDFLATLRVVMWGADVGAGGGEDTSGVTAPHLLRDFVRATG